MINPLTEYVFGTGTSLMVKGGPTKIFFLPPPTQGGRSYVTGKIIVAGNSPLFNPNYIWIKK